MEMMYYQQLGKGSYFDSLKVFEADIPYANALFIQMVDLNYQFVEKNQQLEIFMVRQSIFSIELREKRHLLCLIHTIILFGFLKKKIASVILPSLQRIHNDFVELDSNDDNHGLQSISNKRLEVDSGLTYVDTERDDECGICLEPCTKMVLPNCCHAMCINCYHDWNTRFESCPFCRGTIRRVKSRDLWVLRCKDDVVDPNIVSREDSLRFYHYIRNLPKDYPDALFLMYNEYLI